MRPAYSIYLIPSNDIQKPPVFIYSVYLRSAASLCPSMQVYELSSILLARLVPGLTLRRLVNGLLLPCGPGTRDSYSGYTITSYYHKLLLPGRQGFMLVLVLVKTHFRKQSVLNRGDIAI